VSNRPATSTANAGSTPRGFTLLSPGTGSFFDTLAWFSGSGSHALRGNPPFPDALRRAARRRASHTVRSHAERGNERHTPQGFTLLEVLLTLMLTSLVLVALAMAVDFQLRVVDRSRGNVEEAQLARALLHRIANDLRGAVAYDPLEMEKLVAEAISSASGSVQGAVASAAGSADGAADSSGSGTAGTETSQGQDTDAAGTEDSQPDETDMETDAETESAVPRSVPGVYGESDWLQVDVSRLPRLDQFQYLVASTEGSTTLDRLSDVKTVSYYAIPYEDGGAYAEDGTPTSGLVRRELDRAVSAWASDQGELDQTDTDATPIAPEVSAIEFRYHDGTEWVESWDSDEAGALPKAVEITLTIMPSLMGGPQSSSLQTSQMSTGAIGSEEEDEESLLTYRLIVHLVAGTASSSEDATAESTSEETSEEMEGSGTESGSSAIGSSDEEPTR